MVQRRALRASRDLRAGEILSDSDLEALRPAPPDCIIPFQLPQAVGETLNRDIERGDYPRWDDFG